MARTVQQFNAIVYDPNYTTRGHSFNINLSILQALVKLRHLAELEELIYKIHIYLRRKRYLIIYRHMRT